MRIMPVFPFALRRRCSAWGWGHVFVIGFGIFTVLFLLWPVFQWGGEAHTALVSDLAVLPINLAAVVMLWRASTHPALDRQTRHAWRVLTLAFILSWIGNVLWFYYDIIKDEPPFPSWADAGFLSSIPVIFWGLLSFPVARHRDNEQITFWLDVGTVLVGSGVVFWHFIVRPAVFEIPSPLLTTVLSLAYPLADLVMLFGMTVIMLRQPAPSSRRALRLLIAGLFVFFGYDMLFNYLNLQGVYQPGHWIDGLWLLAYYLVLISAHVQYRQASSGGIEESSDVASVRPINWLPYTAIMLGYGVLLVAALDILSQPLGSLIIGAMVLTALVVARQVVAVRHNVRLLAERAALRSEARFRSLVQHASDVIMVIDQQGTIQYQTPSAERIFGYAAAGLRGTSLKDMLHPGDVMPFLGFMARATHQPDITGPVEWRVRHHDGRWLHVETLGNNLLADPNVNGLVLTMRDITERKKIEQMKDEFVSVVSHELRTPLTSIRGSLGLIAGGVTGELAPQARAMIDIAHKNSERLVRLINDILDIEKIESGKMIFALKPMALLPIIEQSLADNQGYAAQLGISMILEQPAPDVIVNADSDRLIQVMTNLLSNAAKFSPPGGTVRVSVARSGYGVRISVADQGPGIPESFRDRIFHKFAQADASDAREKQGTGLGLSITRAIVERCGGQIGFTTQAGAGTTFFVDLPVWDAPPLSAPDMPEGCNHRILVCEDDHDIAALLRLLLERLGCRTDTAYSAAQARALLAQHGYDAMILDIGLPDQDGVALIRALCADAQTRQLPIVVVSAQAERGREVLNGDAFLIVDWLEKPIDHQRLIAAVRHAVQSSRCERPRILHIEDDPDILKIVATIVAPHADVSAAAGLQEAARRLGQEVYDLVILDLALPDGSGFELLPLLRSRLPSAPILIFSAHEFQTNYGAQIAATLVKSRTSNQKLLATIIDLLGRGEKSRAAAPWSSVEA